MSKKRAKRKKFRKVSFKLSKKEYEILLKAAEYTGSTPNKFIKKSIRLSLTEIIPLLKDKSDISENQLSLFDFERKNNQFSMLEEYKEFYEDDE